jgi:integrase/recombinase XerD
MTPIAPFIEAFLRETLVHQRGASRHTCDSYAQSFQLLFEFAAARLKSKPSKLMLEQMTPLWSAPSSSISRINAKMPP